MNGTECKAARLKNSHKAPAKESEPKPLDSLMMFRLDFLALKNPADNLDPPAISHPLTLKMTSSNHDGRRLSVTDRS